MPDNTKRSNQSAAHADSRALVQVLQAPPQLEFAVLAGSRATGTARADSIALQWSPQVDWLSTLGAAETLRPNLAGALQRAPDAIDLIELRRANLAMRASVAEEGVPLTGQNSLAWAHFLQRTWRDLEDFYWSQSHPPTRARTDATGARRCTSCPANTH